MKTSNYLCGANYYDCTKRVKYMRKIIDEFLKRFSRTYLNEIRQHDIYRKFKSWQSQWLVVGDVVLIRDDQPISRNQWLRLGNVESLTKRNDKEVRGAKITVISKNGKRGTAYWPVQNFIPFKILKNRTEDEMEKNIDSNSEVPVDKRHNSNRRLTRKPATVG